MHDSWPTLNSSNVAWKPGSTYSCVLCLSHRQKCSCALPMRPTPHSSKVFWKPGSSYPYCAFPAYRNTATPYPSCKNDIVDFCWEIFGIFGATNISKVISAFYASSDMQPACLSIKQKKSNNKARYSTCTVVSAMVRESCVACNLVGGGGKQVICNL